MLKQKIIRIASDPDIATDQINEAIANLDGEAYFLLPIYPDTILIEYDSEGEVSDSYKIKLLRIASDPDIATEQINDAIKALGDEDGVEVEDIKGIYPDTVMIEYGTGNPNYHVKVVRIAADPKMATDQINEAIADIYKTHSKARNIYTYVLYSDTLLVTYDYNE